MSQPKLAKLTGIPQTYISRIERGEVGLPQRATREKFHAALGTTERDWLDAAGGFGTDEGDVAPPPAEGTTLPSTLAVAVAYLESHPDPEFQVQRAGHERRLPRAEYVDWCVKIYGLWMEMARLSMRGDELGQMSGVNPKE